MKKQLYTVTVVTGINVTDSGTANAVFTNSFDAIAYAKRHRYTHDHRAQDTDNMEWVENKLNAQKSVIIRDRCAVKTEDQEQEGVTYVTDSTSGRKYILRANSYNIAIRILEIDLDDLDDLEDAQKEFSVRIEVTRTFIIKDKVKASSEEAAYDDAVNAYEAGNYDGQLDINDFDNNDYEVEVEEC